jgi:hypothetical protein
MSTSGRLVFCRAVGAVPNPFDGDVNNPHLQVNYKYSQPWNNVEGGDFYVPFDGYTESEMNSLVQQKAMEHCNQETQGEEAFVLTDIRGGRI